MNKLKIFSTEAQYDLAKDDFEWATVSFVEDVDEIRYMQKINYAERYLTFKALESGTFTLTVPANVNSTYMTSISYSTNNGETWNTTTIDNTAQTITTPTVNTGGKVLWRGVGKQMANSTSSGGYSQFSSTGNFNVSGNIMSLLYGDEFANQVAFQSDTTYNFARLFDNAIKLITAENLILPATTLSAYCYNNMFSGCTSLTTAPVLPATTLSAYCYRYMFEGCTSLTTAPELPATTLANNCYTRMFSGCSNLNYIKAMFTTTPSVASTLNWVSDVAATGTFVKNSAATWNVTGINGIPTGWTVETASA